MSSKIKIKLYPFKHMLRSIFVYPRMRPRSEHNYDEYWKHRNLDAETKMNSFQKWRADTSLEYIENNSVLLDVGSGDGSMLQYLALKKPAGELIAVDISGHALDLAKKRGIKTYKINITNSDELSGLPSADYIFMFEIIEHVPNSEDMLSWAIKNSKKGVFFSVPNTGFIAHRLRLVLGRFPLQWRIYPSEHVRFWTVRDMKFWLSEQGIKNYELKLYEGIPILNKIWPSLFGQGIWVFIPHLL